MAFFHCREEGKIPALLHLLKDVMPAGQQAVVFCATRHHVEYLHLVLDAAGVSNTFIYSHLGRCSSDILFLKHDSNILRQSCGSWKSHVNSLLAKHHRA